ncbi:MAG: 16S rRNA (guanine(527)-N(7))-methyltransferase RsmG [Aquificae bacterium]|nr:16S rRNA (guanine(527)-N(7))-methyltransferase RsmG [Aquificota bacterium]
MVEKLKQLAEKNGIHLTDEMLSKFEKYLELLSKWNRVYNLTSIRKKDEIITKHFLDSLTLVKLFEEEGIPVEGKKVADLGAGGGFPSVPLKIYYGDKFDLYTIEAVQKKCLFLETLARELGLDFKVLCDRAENINMDFDIVLSRATGDTFDVLKWGKGLLKPDGYLIIMKGKKVEEEVKPFTISKKFHGLPERKFVVIKKQSG